MNFDPMAKEDMLQLGLLPKGTYPFVVKTATEKTSKAGNPQVQVLLTIYDERGREHLIYDYLSPILESKLRHFCYAVGLGIMSEQGKFDTENVIGQQGLCKVYVQEDKTGQYSPKNAIGDYLIEPDAKSTSNKEQTQLDSHDMNDQIPF